MLPNIVKINWIRCTNASVAKHGLFNILIANAACDLGPYGFHPCLSNNYVYTGSNIPGFTTTLAPYLRGQHSTSCAARSPSCCCTHFSGNVTIRGIDKEKMQEKSNQSRDSI